MGIEPTVAHIPVVADKPRNGWAGLRHWRYDVPSGFLVALISLPFSLGIAVASGAPPICGITSAIIAGFVLPFLGGSYVTISGPAAGLAPALFAGMIALGGNTEQGYPLLLVAICLTGALQIVLSRLKVARLSALFPAAVIEGMLAAIGLMIIVKQFPLLMGLKFEAHEFWEIIEEAGRRARETTPAVLGLGVGSLAFIVLLATAKNRWLKVVPPQVIAVVVGTLVARLALDLDGAFLINIPDAPLANGLVLPKFDAFAASELWLPLATIVVTLTLIDGVESLATIAAVDKIDPFRRKSDPDRTLLAMGVSNICSSLAGGLTIIPGGVKSTANVLGGGRTQWANFYNACFLLLFLFFGRSLINTIPLSVLAAVLLFTGYKLCAPKVWRRVARVGREQLVIFSATVLITVSTDLLVGIVAGIALKLSLCAWYNLRAAAAAAPGPAGRLAEALDLVRNPVGRRELAADGTYTLYLERPLVCFNLLHIVRELARVPAEAALTRLEIGAGVRLIDHTSCEMLLHYREGQSGEGGRRVEIAGLERLHKVGVAENCMRLALLHRPQARARARHDAVREHGRGRGVAWVAHEDVMTSRVISGLELLYDRDDVEHVSATDVLAALDPGEDETFRADFWRRQAGTDSPRPAFVRGFVEGALQGLDEAKLRHKLI